jgi:two-component system sensor histidine kinase/response regulator
MNVEIARGPRKAKGKFMSQIPDNQLTSGEYQTIFEVASDGLVVYDIELNSVVEANPAACEMHGYTPEEFIGLKPTAFMPAESHDLFMEQVMAAGSGGMFEFLVAHLRKDGSAFHVEVHGSVINHRGRPCLLNIIRDVSKRMRTEKIRS